jgi:serine/threonine protein kinase
MTGVRRPRPSTRKHKSAIRPGARVAGFRVGELLYEGGMSRIYHASHPRRGLALVLKAPRLGPDAPLLALNAFENECRILKGLRGSHVPRIIAVNENSANPYLVMEFIVGDALFQASQRAPLPVKELVTLAIPLCRALHDLHRQNVVHLDLNPGNVRNRADGEAVLIDFGIAHHAGMPDAMDIAFGDETGTAPYIAPEQLRHLRSESRSDIYALGAILYQLATGHYPFGRPNLMSLKRRLVQPPSPPRFYNPHIPPWLQEIVLRCLEIRPGQRYETAKQIAHLLTHPDAVTLTRRAHRTHPADRWTRTRQWFRSLYRAFENEPALRPQDRAASSPHVLVTLDPLRENPALLESLRQTVARIARNEPHSYFTCLSVVGEDELRKNPDTLLERQVALRRWAKPLGLPPERIVAHVVPGPPTALIVEYARQYAVDQIVLCARGQSTGRWWRRVSDRVPQEAPCTVIMVRARHTPTKHSPPKRIRHA